MKKVVKWLLVVVGGLAVLIVAALLIIPRFVDLQRYKPQIEKQVSEVTGRSFRLGGDLTLSLFPWAGISLADLHLGSLPGFDKEDLLTVRSFEVRVKLVPLLFRNVQVKRFILEGAHIVLERDKNGRGNWEGIEKPSDQISPKAPEEKKRVPETGPAGGLPIETLEVGEFAITDGSVLWIDHANGEQKDISDLTLRLEDVSLDRPVQVTLSAKLDGRPLSLEGNVGPVGKEPGKGTIPLVLEVKALTQLEMNVQGKIVDPATRPEFDLDVALSSFSPRKLMAALGQAFPVETADAKALDHVALKAKVKGDPQSVAVTHGAIDLDQSKIGFSVKLKDFSGPDVAFDVNLDEIDLDRYLPPSSPKRADEEEETAEAPAAEQKKIDYTPLRRVILAGTIKVGKLKAQGAKIHDIYMKISGKDGRFNIDPFTLQLYDGDVSSKGALDVRRDEAVSNLELHATGIRVGPLLKDVLKNDFLEGTAQSKVIMRMTGDDPERIMSTLSGEGDFLLRDGAIVGIDLEGMVRNVKATFGLAETAEEDRPRTDFSELHAPFTITNGVVKTPGTSLTSPLLRVLAAGEASLVEETLDFRVEPKFVATLKGQGDVAERSGVMVPVMVTGTFSSPKFRPDLKGVIKKGLEERLPSELKKILPGESPQEGESKPLEEQAKELLKGLPFGR
jgi:AsmA protein